MRNHSIRHTDSKHIEQQPQEWEEILRDVTVERDRHEVLFDPATAASTNPPFTLQELQRDCGIEEQEQDRMKQAELLRCIIRKKLRGKMQKCMEFLLNAGYGPRKIARKLNLSEDTIRRYIAKSIRIIKECISEEGKTGMIPAPSGKRPRLRVSILALDTQSERNKFLHFVNENQILHLSYRGNEMFREILAVYSIGKSRNRLSRKEKTA